MKRIRGILIAWALLVLAASGVRAHADAALLMEEPYGTFGAINPTGHAAIYLNHICAETPTQLRPCRPGEFGVVISRYHKVGGYDWLAIPLVPYLYAVDHAEDVPATADPGLEAQLRDAYRRQHLLNIIPDAEADEDARKSPKGDWTQLIGASYDRKIYGFQVETTREADARFIAEFNDNRNVSHFNLFFHNCADFSKMLLNVYYPHSIHRNFFIDLGITTPKQVARSLTKYGRRHPELGFLTFVIPQVPGTIHRSHPINGVVESLVKSKKYVVPLFVLSPPLTAGMVVAYLADGRFKAPKDSPREILPGDIENLGRAQGVAVDLAKPSVQPASESEPQLHGEPVPSAPGGITVPYFGAAQ
ncbi:hypothetical protein P8936_17880 [Edaphobacter paludis]|uniref:DUF4105 domain-containing protein n=1 Tax=Edaphobacter paludis TaxID=3035702 RepID=A0AAU7D853_9BACT